MAASQLRCIGCIDGLVSLCALRDELSLRKLLLRRNGSPDGASI
jgi:hypothetical protein